MGRGNNQCVFILGRRGCCKQVEKARRKNMKYAIAFAVLISLSGLIYIKGIEYERLKQKAALADSQRITIDDFIAKQLVFSEQSGKDAALLSAEQTRSAELSRQLRARRVVQTCTQLNDTSEPVVTITDDTVRVLSELAAASGLPKDQYNRGYADPDAPVAATTIIEYLGYAISSYNHCALNYNSQRTKIDIMQQ